MSRAICSSTICRANDTATLRLMSSWFGEYRRKRARFVDGISYGKKAKAPDLVIELTSESTSEEDLDEKFQLYQDVLKVGDYFLFDPLDEYLQPSLKGYHLKKGRYVAIEP